MYLSSQAVHKLIREELEFVEPRVKQYIKDTSEITMTTA